MFGIEGLLAAVCFGIEKIPIRWINIPWKAYWLSRPEKSALMFKKMRLIMTLTGLFVTLVFFFTVHTVVQANTKNVWLNIPINAGAVGILGLSILLVVAAFAITWPPKD
jgi:uncharacterized membrane protein (DUF485 family)